MAGSLVVGMIDRGYDPSSIMACDPAVDQLERLSQAAPACDRLRLYSDSDRIGEADIVVLAVKPQVLRTVALDLAPRLNPEAMVISVAAGISIDSLQSWLGDRAIVRCMPNTPALIRQGAAGLCANDHASPADRQAAEDILSAVGIVHWVDSEDLINVVTAVSGSGPAYFFLFTELMSEIATEMGLEPAVAESLAIQTCVGAGLLAQRSEQSLPELRGNVTSEGGTTHAALESFQADDLKTLVRNAMSRCARRAEDMARDYGKPTDTGTERGTN